MKEIKLKDGYFVKVDDADFEWLSQFKWILHKQTNGLLRCIRYENQKTISMSRAIMGVNDSKILVDHKDHDPLNNQRSNLRLCTKQQNNFNKLPAKNSSSKYLGVSWDKENKKWVSCIMFNRKHIKIGRFINEEDAAIAYNKKAAELFGEFANLNRVA